MSIAWEPVGCSVGRQSRGVPVGCQSSFCSRRRVILNMCSMSEGKTVKETPILRLQSRFGSIRIAINRSLGRRGSISSGRNNQDERKAIICQGAVTSTDTGNSLPWASNLAPLAVLALVFSKAAAFMFSLREEIQLRRNDGECAEREFCEAAEKDWPWKPAMTKALSWSGGISMALLSTTAKDHLTPVILTLRANPTFMSGLIAWAVAQVMKIFTYYVVVRKWDFRMVLGSGGMPSSHSALCFALTTSVALVHGVADGLFPVCLGFTLIVMYDAAGVRRHAGKQAEILNIIVADMFQGHPISERKLKELLGHTPLQVFAGAALGILVGYLCSSRT